VEGPRKAAADAAEGRVDPLIGGTIEYREPYIGKTNVNVWRGIQCPGLYTPIPMIFISCRHRSF